MRARRVGIGWVVVLALAGACSSAAPRPDTRPQIVKVGSGVSTSTTGDLAAHASSSSSPGGDVDDGAGAASRPPVDVSPHPTNTDGARILNVTERTVDGLQLTFRLEGQLTYDTSDEVLMQLTVRNQGDTPVTYDASPPNAAFVRQGDAVVWTSDCNGFESFPLATELDPGHPVTFQWRFPGSGDCGLSPGEYTAHAVFALCPEETLDRDERGNAFCDVDAERRLGAHPLTFTLE